MDHPPTAPPIHRSRRGPGRVLLVPVLAAFVLAGSVATAGARSDGDRADRLTMAGDRAARATAARVAAGTELARVSARRRELESQARMLDAADAEATTQLVDARRQVRELAVAAYIDGGRTELLQASLAPDEAAAVSWRVGLVTGGAGEVSRAVGRYEHLVAGNDPQRRSVAEQVDRARADEQDAWSALVQASATERDASTAAAAASEVLVGSDPATAGSVRSAAVRPSSASATPPSPARPPASAAGLPRPSAAAGATAEESAFLARVRACESRGIYTVVSGTGRYRGAYQFSVETWRGVGGSGDPAAASPAEQDARALALLRLQGRRAWPVCGR